MALSRRGFLHGLMGAAGVAALDPVSKLWLPTRDPIAIIEASTPDAVTAVCEEQLYLNEIATVTAAHMGDLLRNHPAIGLHRVMFAMSGGTYSLPRPMAATSMLINLDHEGGELAVFTPTETRFAPTIEHKWSMDSAAPRLGERFAADLVGHARNRDAFAPIAEELRPGVPFASEVVNGVTYPMLVAVATDPESGISVRALRWRQDGPRYSAGPTVLTSCEIAGGALLNPDRLTYKQLRDSYLRGNVSDMKDW